MLVEHNTTENKYKSLPHGRTVEEPNNLRAASNYNGT
jgi:hypothetical protein